MSRARTVLALIATTALGVAVAEAVQVGQSREEVVAELGRPGGEVQAADRTLLFYPRGEVELREGRVSRVRWASDEEFAAQEAQRRSQAEQRQRLEQEGRGVYEARKKDPAFTALPVEEQLAYWRAFAAHYPMIPVSQEIATLRSRFDQEERMRDLERATEERIAELEARVAEIEQRAALRRYPVRYDGVYGGWPYFASPFFPGRDFDRFRHFRRFPRASAPPPADPLARARADAMSQADAARAEAMSQADAARGRAMAPNGR